MGAKDPNELHKQFPGQFKALMEAEFTVAPMRSMANGGNLRPTIVVNNNQLDKVSTDAYAALIAANNPPSVFNRGGRLCRIAMDDRGRPTIRPVAEADMRQMLSRSADFVRLGPNKKASAVFPPVAIGNNILAQDRYPGIPTLVGIVETPMLRPGGSILSKPGFDPETGLLYVPARDYSMPVVPMSPSLEEVVSAVATIDDLITDFPFVDAASRANLFALLLSSVVRPAIEGKVPLALIDAPQPGTGKSLLVELLSQIGTGRNAPMMTAPTDEDEWRKKITTQLLMGERMIVIDNVVRRLDSAQLCAALSATEWRDRILGSNTEVLLDQRAIWLATGNNMRTGQDLARRSYWIRLDAKSSRPWTGRQFKHPRLREWARTHRGQIIRSLLILARSWFAADRPGYNGPTVGGFEEWCAMIGGILSHADIKGFLVNLDQLYSQSDQETQQWEVFLRAVYNHFGSSPFVANVLAADLNQSNLSLLAALPDHLSEALESGKGGISRKLGRAFADRVDRRYGDNEQFFLERAGEDAHVKMAKWRVSRQSNPASANYCKQETSELIAGCAGLESSQAHLEIPANPAVDPQAADKEEHHSAGSEPELQIDLGAGGECQ
jgi:hypothetical protein